MASDRLEGAWRNLTGKIREEWGQLTDDDVTRAEGRWDQLAGTIQNKYGRTKDAVELEIRRFRDRHEASDNPGTVTP